MLSPSVHIEKKLSPYCTPLPIPETVPASPSSLPVPLSFNEIIFDKVTTTDKVLIPKEQLMEHLKTRNIDCLVSFGAGDVDRFIEPIANWLKTLA